MVAPRDRDQPAKTKNTEEELATSKQRNEERDYDPQRRGKLHTPKQPSTGSKQSTRIEQQVLAGNIRKSVTCQASWNYYYYYYYPERARVGGTGGR